MHGTILFSQYPGQVYGLGCFLSELFCDLHVRVIPLYKKIKSFVPTEHLEVCGHALRGCFSGKSMNPSYSGNQSSHDAYLNLIDCNDVSSVYTFADFLGVCYDSDLGFSKDRSSYDLVKEVHTHRGQSGSALGGGCS